MNSFYKTGNLAAVILFCFMVSPGCSVSPDSKAQNKNTKVPVELPVNQTPDRSVAIDTLSDRIAAWVSGMPGNYKNDSILPNKEAWNKHCSFIDSCWNSLSEKRFNKMVAWRDSVLRNQLDSVHTIFYPFSGPDFFSPSIFFPEYDTIIMIALEPVGKLPDIYKMDEKKVKEFNENFIAALSDFFNKSYFITKNMSSQLQNENVIGLLPVISFFLKRSNNSIKKIQPGAIDNKHGISYFNYNEFIDKSLKARILKIDFVHHPTERERTLYYFRYNLSDQFFNDSSVVYHFVRNSGHMVTYLKSTSYLMHDRTMSNVRKLVLAKSKIILQDDTGVPFRLIENANWNIRLYGAYVKPVEDFPWAFQDDLKKAYDKCKPRKLPFDFGYHWGTKNNNLMLFERFTDSSK